MEFIANLLAHSILQVGTSFFHNWPYLAASVVIAVILKLYIDPQKISAFLIRYRKVGVIGATVAAVATPLCSCGTTAVLLGMMASMIPWAPIIAFMVASPLTSPQELIYSAGLFGWPFALTFFGSSILLGLLGGLAGEILERRGWLANQTRFAAPGAPAYTARPSKIRRPQPAATSSMVLVSSGAAGGAAPGRCGCASVTPSTAALAESEPSGAKCEGTKTSCSCDAAQADPSRQTNPSRQTVSWRQFLVEAFAVGKRLLVMFLGFAFIGYFLNGLIPSAWVTAVFGPGNVYSVPLAATLGLPLYINSEASLPLVRALIDGGMSQGAALAFLITGAGTSIGAFAGALTIARWRVIATVVGTLWLGAVVMGYLYNLLLIAG